MVRGWLAMKLAIYTLFSKIKLRRTFKQPKQLSFEPGLVVFGPLAFYIFMISNNF